MSVKPKYTCNEYREEMILLGLQKRLASEGLTEEERSEIQENIDKLEADMGMK